MPGAFLLSVMDVEDCSEHQNVGVQQSYLCVHCMFQTTYVNNVALFLKSMSFPVDILNNYSHEDLENSAEDYLFDLRWGNPNSPEFFSLPDRRKVRTNKFCSTSLFNVLVDLRYPVLLNFRIILSKLLYFPNSEFFVLNSTFFTL